MTQGLRVCRGKQTNKHVHHEGPNKVNTHSNQPKNGKQWPTIRDNTTVNLWNKKRVSIHFLLTKQQTLYTQLVSSCNFCFYWIVSLKYWLLFLISVFCLGWFICHVRTILYWLDMVLLDLLWWHLHQPTSLPSASFFIFHYIIRVMSTIDYITWMMSTIDYITKNLAQGILSLLNHGILSRNPCNLNKYGMWVINIPC